MGMGCTGASENVHRREERWLCLEDLKRPQGMKTESEDRLM